MTAVLGAGNLISTWWFSRMELIVIGPFNSIRYLDHASADKLRNSSIVPANIKWTRKMCLLSSFARKIFWKFIIATVIIIRKLDLYSITFNSRSCYRSDNQSVFEGLSFILWLFPRTLYDCLTSETIRHGISIEPNSGEGKVCADQNVHEQICMGLLVF